MITTESYSSGGRFGATYRASLTSQLPFAVVSGILSMIALPITFFASIANIDFHNFTRMGFGQGPGAFFSSYFQQGIYAADEIGLLCMIFLLLITFCATLYGLSYMHSKRSVDLYHSLPVTRPQLLSANLLAALTAVLAPFYTVYLLTMLIQLVGFGHYGWVSLGYFQYILFDTLSMLACVALLCAFIALMSVCVGTVFDAFAMTMAIGFTPMAAYLIGMAVWGSIAYGASFSAHEITMLLSPITCMFYRYMLVGRSAAVPEYDYCGWAILNLCALVAALILFVAAVALYKRRRSELAEQTQPHGPLQTATKCSGALVGGAAFYAIFADTGLAVQLVAMFLGAVLIGMIAELILSRGMKSFRKNIRWIAGAGAVYCALLVCVQFDVFGYETRVPAAEQIEQVQISYSGRFQELGGSQYYINEESRGILTEPDSIELVRAMHELAVANKPAKSEYYGENYTNSQYIRIEYKLKHGSTMSRNYGHVYIPAVRMLADLEDRDDFIRANSALFRMEAFEAESGSLLDYMDFYGNIPDLARQGENRLSKPADMQKLLAAIKTDLLNESLAGIQHPEKPARGFIRIQYRQELDERIEARQVRYHGTPTATVVVTDEYVNTLAVLKELGLEQALDLQTDHIAQVEFYSLDYYGNLVYDNDRVRVLVPWEDGSGYVRPEAAYGSAYAAEYRSSPYNTEYAAHISQDKADIQATAAVGESQLFLEKPRENERRYASARFLMESGAWCIKLVEVERLPDALRQKVQAGFAKADEELHAAESGAVTVIG